MKALIIYFSRADENYAVGYIDKGNTEIVAEFVQELTGADMFKVEPAVPYAADYNTCIKEAKERIGNAPIKEKLTDISAYDTIFIMSPIYWGTYAPEMETALQGLDSNETVVYLGSFSATLFSSIKISYMVLPPHMAEVFRSIRGDYTQTCSKTEQLTLALFMESGYYQTHIKKIRNLYSQKLQTVTKALSTDFTRVRNTYSGLNVIIEVGSHKTAALLAEEAKSVGINAVPVNTNNDDKTMILYYNQIPLADIPGAIDDLLKKWRS